MQWFGGKRATGWKYQGQKRIEVASTGRVLGDIVCDELFIDEGATYRGRILIRQGEDGF